VADLVGEVLRMRNAPDMVSRVRDLEYRLGLVESDTGLQEVSRKVDALIGLARTRGPFDNSPDPLPDIPVPDYWKDID